MSEIIGIGTDITECLRVARMIERYGEQFISRIYTAEEIAYCRSRTLATQHFTGRWAAKEAILRALGSGWRTGIGWRDIEVRTDSAGRNLVAVRGGARDLVEQLGVTRIIVSIAHCRTYATAYAMALDGRPKVE